MTNLTTKSLEALWKSAAETSRMGVDAIRTEIAAPDWDAGRFRWPDYVPTEMQETWGLLSEDARLVAFVFASERCEQDGMHPDGVFGED